MLKKFLQRLETFLGHFEVILFKSQKAFFEAMFDYPYIATLPYLQNNDFFQNLIKLWKMVQIRWENISEKAQIFHFPKLIEILQCDRYFLKKVKICPLGHLIHAHHGM